MEINAVAPAVWQSLVLKLGKLALTLLLAWQGSQLVWQIASPAPMILSQPATGGASGNDRPQALAGTGELHLFGVAGAETAAPVAVNPVDAPDTRLRLTLLGVTVATPEKSSSAIISANGKEADFFRIGDTVDGRTRLASVLKDRVILDNAGKLETLRFEEVPGTGSNVVAAPNRPVRTPTRSESAPPRGGNLAERFGEIRSASEFVDVASEELGDDPMMAINKMGLVPRGDGEGYEVKPGSPLIQFQLKPGDVVLTVNDQPLGDPASDQSLLEEIRTAESVRIEVMRGDNRIVVNHRLN